MEQRAHKLFEGNAQSFRIVTFLEPKSIGPVRDAYDRWVGLNLTRATLRAITKYPYVETPAHRNHEHPKFSVYSDDVDKEYFAWLWDGHPEHADKTLATRIMDVADDITYATHDFEDGVWSGMIPTYQLFGHEPDEAAVEDIVRKLGERDQSVSASEVADALETIKNAAIWEARLAPEQVVWLAAPFERTRQNVAYLKRFTAALIGLLIDLVTPGGSFTELDPFVRLQVDVLTAIAWVWMIERSDLATTQYGQRRLVGELFEAYFDDPLTLPRRQEVRELEGALLPDDTWPELARLICDHIAGMTDDYALAAHRAMYGGQTTLELRYAY
jgi:dGTPase